MMKIDRSNVVLVLVVVAAIAVASVVAVHGHAGSGATAMSAYGAENPSAAGLADASTVGSSTSGVASAVDPAKQEPTLDQFHSRNPFIQATAVPTTSPSGGSSPAPSGTPTASPSSSPAAPTGADIHVTSGSIDKTYTNQKIGAELPPGSSPAFKVTAISVSEGVTLTWLEGHMPVEGEDTDTVPVYGVGTFTLAEGSQDVVYKITIVKLDYPSGSGSGGGSGGSNSTSGGGSGSGSTSYDVGHAIKAVSVDTSNGVPSATLVVDGTTYAAKKVGAVFDTAWGQVKILGINGPGQTVTVLHADVQLTLRVGQSVSK